MPPPHALAANHGNPGCARGAGKWVELRGMGAEPQEMRTGWGAAAGISVAASVPAQRELAGTSLFARLSRFRGCIAALQN